MSFGRGTTPPRDGGGDGDKDIIPASPDHAGLPRVADATHSSTTRSRTLSEIERELIGGTATAGRAVTPPGQTAAQSGRAVSPPNRATATTNVSTEHTLFPHGLAPFLPPQALSPAPAGDIEANARAAQEDASRRLAELAAVGLSLSREQSLDQSGELAAAAVPAASQSVAPPATGVPSADSNTAPQPFSLTLEPLPELPPAPPAHASAAEAHAAEDNAILRAAIRSGRVSSHPLPPFSPLPQTGRPVLEVRPVTREQLPQGVFDAVARMAAERQAADVARHAETIARLAAERQAAERQAAERQAAERQAAERDAQITADTEELVAAVRAAPPSDPRDVARVLAILDGLPDPRTHVSAPQVLAPAPESSARPAPAAAATIAAQGPTAPVEHRPAATSARHGTSRYERRAAGRAGGSQASVAPAHAVASASVVAPASSPSTASAHSAPVASTTHAARHRPKAHAEDSSRVPTSPQNAAWLALGSRLQSGTGAAPAADTPIAAAVAPTRPSGPVSRTLRRLNESAAAPAATHTAAHNARNGLNVDAAGYTRSAVPIHSADARTTPPVQRGGGSGRVRG